MTSASPSTPTETVPRLALVVLLRRLFVHLSVRRRQQSVIVFGLILVGAVAELLTLGAVLPFLAVVTNPDGLVRYQRLGGVVHVLIGSNPQNQLMALAGVFVAAAFLAGAVRMLVAWITQKYVYRVGYDISTGVYERLLDQTYSFHVARNSSEFLAAFSKAQIVTIGVIMPLMNVVTGFVVSMAIIGGLTTIDPVSTLAAGLAFAMCYAVLAVVTRKRMLAASKAAAESQSNRIKSVQEGLGGIRDILLDRGQSIYVAAFKRADLRWRNAQAVSAFVATAPRFAIEAFGMALIAGLAVMLSRGPDGLSHALPVLGGLALGAQRLLPMLQSVYSGWIQVAGNRHSLIDVLSFLDLPRQPQSVTASMDRLPFRRSLAFHRVGFAYRSELPAVLSDIDLVIRRGERVGLIGPSGSGKSTLTDLAMGLLNPTAGEIRIDDTKLADVNLRAWQARIAHVPQAIYLADVTIAENIAFGVPVESIDHARVRASAASAELTEFVEALPDSFATPVGERGVRLSGGQRQRIGIARALYKQPDLLVLDEATSALDNDTEAAIMRAISGLSRDLTILMVAHRLSTVAGCDRLVRIERGRVVASGPPREILAAE